jgi:glucuronoarabinoxylan endo-1,4-beta-xylanase
MVLVDFAAKTKTNTGVDLYAISVENEPNYAYAVAYDGCVYDPAQMVAFIKVLGPKLHALSPAVKVMAPESYNWKGLASFANAIKADATADRETDIFATHDYEHGAVSYGTPGRPIWETEVSGMSGSDDGMSNGMVVAGWVHDGLTTGNASAWHYWWLDQTNGGASTEGLMRNGKPAKRFYVLGNWSKFVRPGYTRVSVTGGTSGVKSTGFVGPDGTVVVVAIANSAATFSATIQGVSPATVTPWTTSADASLTLGTAIAVTSGRFTASLTANSVTTFVGK